MGPAPAGSHREQKRERTKAAIFEAAVGLFESKGYHETTIADIAAAAGVAPRTFFSYYASKDELVFDQAETRIGAAYKAIAERRSDDGATEVLLRSLTDLLEAGHDFGGRHGELRARLIRTVPAIRGRALQLQVDAQREIARLLHDAYSGELDQITTGALVGAFVGAVNGAVQAMYDTGPPADPATRSAVLRRSVEASLPAWATRPRSGAS
jgi:AcrR family transcriptional regulator